MQPLFCDVDLMITIYLVKLNVKFPCKMKLYQQTKLISGEVEGKHNIFTFNQEITIMVNPQQNLQISAYLSTGKGGSIFAGLINVSVAWLLDKKRQKVSLPLQKCIDPEAIFQMTVNQVSALQQRSTSHEERCFQPFIQESPIMKLKHESKNQQAETRSQIQASPPHKVQPARGRSMMKFDKQLELKKLKNKQQINPNLYIRDDQNDQFLDDILLTKTILGNVPKHLKQKAQKFNQKPHSNENIPLNLLHQKQKSLTQKIKTSKQYHDKIISNQIKHIQQLYVKQQLFSKQDAFKILSKHLNQLNLENIQLKSNTIQLLKSITELKQNAIANQNKYQQSLLKQQQQFKSISNQSKSKIKQLQTDNNCKQLQLIKYKKYIEQLQLTAKQKQFEHDRTSQQLKKQTNHSLKTISLRIIEYQSKIQQLSQQLLTKTTQLQQLSNTILKYEQNIKDFSQNIEQLQKQKQQLLQIKTNYHTLTRKYIKIQQDLKNEQKYYKKIQSHKNQQLINNQQIYHKQIKYIQNKLQNTRSKNKQYKQKIQQQQNLISIFKLQQDKFIKKLSKFQKSNSQLLSKLQFFQIQKNNQCIKLQINTKEFQQKYKIFQQKQSFYLLQIQHQKSHLNTLTNQFEDISLKYNNTQQLLQTIKNEKIKLQNKIQLLQDQINHLNDYIKQKKIQFQNKQNLYKQQLYNLSSNFKNLQDKNKNLNKLIHSEQIKNLIHTNKIQKLEQLCTQSSSKIQKYQKVTLKRLQEQKDTLSKQLVEVTQKLHQSLQQNTFIIMQRTKLQKQTTTNTKINTVLNQQNIINTNQLNKLKNSIIKFQQIQQKLTNQIKISIQQNKTLKNKINHYEHQINKIKQTIKQTVNNILNSKKELKELLPLKKQQSIIDSLNNSRNTQPRPIISFQPSSSHFDIKKISQFLQSSSKQQHYTILTQQQSIIHYKQTLDQLQQQLLINSSASQNTIQQLNLRIRSFQFKIDQSNNNNLQLKNNCQDKLQQYSIQITKKNKNIKTHQQQISSLKSQLQSNKKYIQLLTQQLKIQQYNKNTKIQQLQNQLTYLQNIINNLQSNKKNIQFQLYQYENNLTEYQTSKNKKQKYLNQIHFQLFNIIKQNQSLIKIKNTISQSQINTIQQCNNYKLINFQNQLLLNTQYQNNKKLQDFVNNLIKNKQHFIKQSIQNLSKISSLENNILSMNNLISNQCQQIKQKQQQNLLFKNNIKILQNDLKKLQLQSQQCNNQINNLTTLANQNDKTLLDKQNQIKQLSISINKHKQQLAILKDQNQSLKNNCQLNHQQRPNKFHPLQKQNSASLQQQFQRSSTDSPKQQPIFTKQKTQITQTTVNHTRQSQIQPDININKLLLQISQLNQQLRQKQQMLYQYSSKIYQFQQLLSTNNQQHKLKQLKINNNWKCKFDQLSQQYQHQIQIIEKQKLYLKDQCQQIQSSNIKIQAQKDHLIQLHKKQIITLKKQQQLQYSKQVNLKSKQIDHLKNQITLLLTDQKTTKSHLQKKQSQLSTKQQQLKKCQQKYQTTYHTMLQQKKQHQQQLLQYKNKQITLITQLQKIANKSISLSNQIKSTISTFTNKISHYFSNFNNIIQDIQSMEYSLINLVNFQIHIPF